MADANGKFKVKMIATDGVFSMDGEIAHLDKITELARKYGAIVFVDDCHATGFFGPTGRYLNPLTLRVEFFKRNSGAFWSSSRHFEFDSGEGTWRSFGWLHCCIKFDC